MFYRVIARYSALFFVFLVLPSVTLAAVLPNGGTISEAISTSGEVDVHTFSANAGDSVLLRVADTESTEFVSAPFYPRIELYDPSGTFLASGQGYLVGALSRALVVSGTYEVRVFDNSSGNDDTGTYDLSFARMPGANEGGSLPNGSIVQEVIGLGDLDTYTFDADAGESIYLSVADTETTEFVNAAFYPRIELYAPNGSFVASAQGSLVGRMYQALTVSGIYTVVVMDNSSGDDAVGSYDLRFAKTPGANEGGTLPNGEFVSDEIDLGDIDTYTFTANAGESVFLRVADTESTEFVSAPFYPRVVLFAPNGSFIGSGQGSLVGDLYSALTVSGTYTVAVYDESSGDDATGSYDLYYSKALGANDGNGISGGETKSGFIDLGDLDAYAFEPDILGANALFSLTDLDEGALYPRMSLFGPNGAFITSSQGANTTQLNRTLTEWGTYTLIIYDNSSGDDATGNYQLMGVGNFTGVPGSTIDYCNGSLVTVYTGLGQMATSRADVILGTAGPDIIDAFGGDDIICALGGADTINAGNGNDWVDAGTGNDYVQGGGGIDTIYGAQGNDELFGGPGGDSISGEEGNDIIYGNSGSDDIDGGDGVDNIRGGSGNDIIATGAGATVGTTYLVDAGAGNDTITGGVDADVIRGSSDKDTIRGGGGDDNLFGGGGEDTIHGEGGNDFIRGNAANDRLTGGAGQDNIDGSGSKDLILGGADDDMLAGATGNDEIRGGAGNDTISGGGGNDRLFGDSGEDDIKGGGSNDTMSGGSGSPDRCDGEGGIDTADASCEIAVDVP